MKLNFTRQHAILSSLFLPIACFTGNKAQNPNVLVIIADDMGWGDIGYNNPAHVYTPNLDRLAGAGAQAPADTAVAAQPRPALLQRLMAGK